MIIAIDGPAASGKGTLAKRLAQHFGLPHLDTGLIYRATARQLLDAGDALDDVVKAAAIACKLTPDSFDEERLRGRDMGEAASIVAAIPEVRAALLDMQRRFAQGAAGAVLDGRDIGTVVCPQADHKIFVTATPQVRATRRASELAARGEPSSYQAILADIKARDERDMHRTTAPLAKAADAVELDTTDLDVDAAFQAALAIIGVD
ncbi:MAG TPA: (d)CMP kinase [Beijerinckiaceae bacterium]|nr:(d)CMP kinase [Beijerinckiaceae bacterium]